ncbi:hypothetical protein UCDDS831_g05167 [Diplodia seriata]|uniref:Uncharacterized protein n=1 Tax=Diplodia seriata TaxID=420778 RepID=A0A0G2EA81_9PEZI|nr:hypothetical protein UCDDS831_g05167 [Diplodia seriata]
MMVQDAEFYLECGVDYEENDIEFPEGYKISKRAPIQGVSFNECVEFCARLCDPISDHFSDHASDHFSEHVHSDPDGVIPIVLQHEPDHQDYTRLAYSNVDDCEN